MQKQEFVDLRENFNKKIVLLSENFKKELLTETMRPKNYHEFDKEKYKQNVNIIDN